MPGPLEISKIKAAKPTSGKSHVNVNPTIDTPKTQGSNFTPASATLNRTSKPPSLKSLKNSNTHGGSFDKEQGDRRWRRKSGVEEGFTPAASVKFAQSGTLPRAGIQKAPAVKLPTTKQLPKMMTGPKTARSYARRLARITPANSVQKTTQGTSLPGANFMASETKNEDVEVKKFPQGPNDLDPLATTELKSAMASASMKTLKQNLGYALKKDDPDHNVDPEGAVMDQLAGAPYNKSDGGPNVDTEELLAQQHKTGEYKFESTEPIEEVSDELLYRAQSKAQHLRDKASTQKARSITRVAKTGNIGANTPEWKSYVKHSDETTKRHNQALRFWRARGRQGSFKPHKED